MTKQEEKRLVEIQGIISELQKSMKKYEEIINNPDNEYHEKQYAKLEVEETKRTIGNYAAEREFIIIKKHLAEEGVNFNKYPYEDDVKRIEMIQSGDKTYIEYQIDYHNFYYLRRIKDEKYIESLRGVVIYNSKYEILYNKSEFVDLKNDKTGSLINTSISRFRDNTIDNEFVLNEGNDLIIDLQGIGISYNKIYHFKLKDGKYEIVHTFTRDDHPKCDIVTLGKKINILTDANGKKYAEYYGRLYDIESSSYFNDIAFDKIYDSYSNILPSFSCDSSEQIRQIMKDNNVFLGYISKYSFLESYLSYLNIYGYMDTKGNLVSDLIYHQKTSNEIYPPLFSAEVKNDTYYETLNGIVEKNKELELKKKEEERRREEERRKESERRAKEAKLREQRIQAERLAFITKIVPKKLELTLDEKKEQN